MSESKKVHIIPIRIEGREHNEQPNNMENGQIIPMNVEGDIGDNRRKNISVVQIDNKNEDSLEKQFVSQVSIISNDEMKCNRSEINMKQNINETDSLEENEKDNLTSDLQNTEKINNFERNTKKSICTLFDDETSPSNCRTREPSSSRNKYISEDEYERNVVQIGASEEDNFFNRFKYFKARSSCYEDIERTLGKPCISEKVVFVIDLGLDRPYTSFICHGKRETPLSAIKCYLNKYLYLQNREQNTNEYAIILLREYEAEWYLDFTKDTQMILETVHCLTECHVEDVFDFNQVFKMFESIKKPPINNKYQTPNYVIHPIIFYNRSYTIPEYDLDNFSDTLHHEHFALDIVYSHETIGCDNNVEHITNLFCNLNAPDGNNFVIPVARKFKKFIGSINRTIGHPFQRPRQIIK